MVLLNSSKVESITMIVFPAIALYNVIELNFILFGTFKRRSGLYFWSFLIATWGIVPQAVAALTETFLSFVGVGLATMYILGWYCMVTGQSLVLYSRLHLLVHNPTILRCILGMIITNAILGHIPPTILAYGKDAGLTSFQGPYAIYEKIQVTLFFVQEVVISCLYIHEAIKLMRIRKVIDDGKGRARKLLIHLFVVNAVVILLDVNILAMEYAGLHNVQTSVKTFVYSVKLKVEFSVLNKLVELTRRRSGLSEGEDTPVNSLGVVRVVNDEEGGSKGGDLEGKVEMRKVEVVGDLEGMEMVMGDGVYVGPGGKETGKGGMPAVVTTMEVSVQGRGSGGDGDREGVGGGVDTNQD